MTRTWEELSEERKTLARTRGQDIIQLRAEGKTYTDIGKIIGLSGSRCRDLELRHIRHLNFHKNYPLIKSWDESVRAAFAAKPPDNANWARKHHNAIYYFCSRDKPTQKDFAELLYPSLQAIRSPLEWKGHPMTPEEKIELLEKAIKQATDLLIQSSKTDDPAVDWAAKTTALGVLLKATEEKKH
jgi:hypothetical protein